MTKRHERDEASDADAFARAMAEENVVPLPSDSHRRVGTKTPVSLPPIENPAAAPRRQTRSWSPVRTSPRMASIGENS